MMTDDGCEWQSLFRGCGLPVSGFRLYNSAWLRVCWLHAPAELALAA